jgi:hypothetical protein
MLVISIWKLTIHNLKPWFFNNIFKTKMLYLVKFICLKWIIMFHLIEIKTKYVHFDFLIDY